MLQTQTMRFKIRFCVSVFFIYIMCFFFFFSFVRRTYTCFLIGVMIKKARHGHVIPPFREHGGDPEYLKNVPVAIEERDEISVVNPGESRFVHSSLRMMLCLLAIFIASF